MDAETNTNRLTVYDYIIQEETAYKTMKVPIVDGYDFGMYEHIQKTILYKNSKFSTGADDGSRPFKNIIRPILNVAYQSENIEVKDIQPFVDDAEDYYLSFLVKKFHDGWAIRNDIDVFLDDLVESYVDFGGVLAWKANQSRPVITPWSRIAFCDQTDILSAPICEKFSYSPSELSDQPFDKDKIDEALTMFEAERTVNLSTGTKKARTPGRFITVYRVHGQLPTWWLEDKYENNEVYTSFNNADPYTLQTQYITYYEDDKGGKHGICLFKTREKNLRYKFKARDKIFGRALGFGGVEELFEAQVWTNYSIIQVKEMLDVASLVLLQTADPAYATRNKISDLQKGTILVHEPNSPLEPVDTQPINLPLFEKSAEDWEEHARVTGAATDPQLGIEPSSGTPFRLQDLVLNTGKDLHRYRQGQIASFISELYRDWIFDYLITDMKKGDRWLSELSLDEMQQLADTVSTNMANEKMNELVIQKGKIISQADYDTYKKAVSASFMKGGNKKFLELATNEVNEIPIEVHVNVAGKQKDLNSLTDKLTNIFRQVIANPAVLQNPAIAKIFNQLLEGAGLSAVDFSGLETPSGNPQPNPQPAPVNKVALPTPKVTA
jgi:hypothetical protein